MKYFLLFGFLFVTTIALSQKYVLIDKKLLKPVEYTDNVTLAHSYRGYFAVEKSQVKQIIAEVEKITQKLKNSSGLEDSFNYKVGNTSFIGLRIPLAKEERYDVVLSTDCGQVKSLMHLSDAKISNSTNVYYINTWLKYLKNNIR